MRYASEIYLLLYFRQPGETFHPKYFGRGPKTRDGYSSRASSVFIAIMYVCIYGHTYSKSIDQPDKVDNPASGQLNRENECFLVAVRA